jgi:NNP family nitrate/nitrite transporter-like MFS transporter
MALLSGWIADIIGPKKTMIRVLLLTGTMTMLLGLADHTWSVLFVFCQAMLASCFFPPAFATLSSLGLSSSRNLVVSFTVPFGFLAGAGGTPTLIGMLGKEGMFGWGISLVGALIIMGALLAGFLRLQD